jgi:hypothetical protein
MNNQLCEVCGKNPIKDNQMYAICESCYFSARYRNIDITAHIIARNCVICNSPFFPKTHNATVCSKTCRYKRDNSTRDRTSYNASRRTGVRKGPKLGNIPWNKGQSWPEDIRKKISEGTKGREPWNKGVPQTEEHRLKNSESHKGQIPWNYNPSIIKCIVCDKEFLMKVSYAKVAPAHTCSKECLATLQSAYKQEDLNPMFGLPSPTLGIPRDEETKLKISESNKEYARTHPEFIERIRQMGMKNLGQERPMLRGPNNFMWKNTEMARKGYWAMRKSGRENYKDARYPWRSEILLSSWEQVFCALCEAAQIEFTYEPEDILCGDLGYYTIDFKLKKPSLWIEVKGGKTWEGMEKFKYATERLHKDFKLLDEETFVKYQINIRLLSKIVADYIPRGEDDFIDWLLTEGYVIKFNKMIEDFKKANGPYLATPVSKSI